MVRFISRREELFITPLSPTGMLTQIFRISLILYSCVFVLVCPAIASEQKRSVVINELAISDFKENQDDVVMLYQAELVSTCFTMFYLDVAHEETKAVQIGKLTTSYLGTIQDNEVVLGLNDLKNIALGNNRMIEVVRQKQAQNKGQLTQARSEYLPHLSLEGRYTYTERKDSASTDGPDSTTGSAETDPEASDDDEFEKDDVVHGAVNFSQLIYDFGKTTGAIGIGKYNLLAVESQLQRQVQDIIFQVKAAYYSVLEKRRLIDVAAEATKNFEQHLARARLYLKAGVRTRIDVINAEVELSNAKMNLLRAQYNLKTARVALEQVLGTKPNQGRYTLYSDEVHLDKILEIMPPVAESLDTLIENAMERRPDIMQLNKLIEAAKANLKRAKGDYWPSIKAEANYNEYDTDLSLYKDSWEVGVAARWDLFSGLHTKGATTEAQGRLLETKAQLQDLKLSIVREVTESYLQTDENRESVQIALQTLKLAEENLLLAEKRYQSGANDVIEYNDAQLSLTKTRNELVVTYYGYLTALAGVEHAVGLLPTSDQKTLGYTETAPEN